MCNGLAEQVNQLQVTLHKMEVAMGAIADAVVFVGEDSRVQWCNPAFESLVNQSHSTILGAKFNHLLPLMQAGQPVSLESYPDVRMLNGEDAATEYELQLGNNTLVLEITGSCAAIAEGDRAAVLVIRDITQVKEDILERQRAEASLRESEELLRTLINASPDIICFKDGAGRWLESNQANLEFLQVQGIDFKGKTDIELAQLSSFYASALPNCSQTDEEAWLHGSMYRVEEVVPLADGTATIWDMVKVPLFHADGRRKGLVILGRDITDRKRAEEALQASEAQYRDLVQTANSMILRWDTQGNIQFLNEYGQRFFGFNTSEIIGRNVVGTIVSETETSGRDLQALMTDICQHPENYLFNENENICKNGKQVWIAWANKPILDAQGNLIEILSVGTDATERKQAQTALENSLSLVQATFESIQDGILAVNRAGNIVSYNQSFLEMWSVTPEILAEPEHGKRIAYLANQLKDPNEFTKRVKGLYATPEADSHDLLDLADGRVFERYSCPQRVGDMIVGRVWSFRDITARQRAEAALEASEIKFRNIVENANDILFVLNPEGIFSYLSPNVFNIMGYEPAEMEGGSFVPFVHSDDQLNCINAVNTVVTTGQGQSGLEYRARYKDGKYYWQVANIAASQDVDGNLTVVGIARDITERKQTEEALRQSEARFRGLYEATSLAVLVADDNGTFDCNSAAEKLFGYSRQELIGKLAPDFSPPFQPNGQDSFSLAFRQMAIAFEQGSYCFEWIHRRADGTDFPAEVWLSAVEVGNRKCVQAIVQDLTERRRAEAALQQSELKFRSIVENANNIIYLQTLEGIFTYLSPNVTSILGYDASELEGQSLVAILHPDDLTTCFTALQRVVELGKQSGIEVRVKRKDESWLWFSCTISTVQDPSGATLVLGVGHDITDRKQAEEALQKSEARFRALYESTNIPVLLTDDVTTGKWDCNSATEKLLGYSPQDFQERIKHAGDIAPPFQPNGQDSYSLADENIARAYKQGTYYTKEWIHRRPDGTDVPLEVWLTTVEIEEGKFIGQAILQDLTERKRAEAALAERAKLAAFRADVGSALAQSHSLPVILNHCAEAAIKHLNTALVGIWTLDSQGDVFKLQARAAMDASFDASYSHIPASQLVIAQMPQHNVRNTVFEDWATQEGMVAFASYPLRLEEQLLGMLAIFAKSELSELTRQALEFAAREIALGIKRKQAEEALRHSELKYRNIFENSQVAIGVTRWEDGLYLDANQRCAEIIGFSSAADLIGKRSTSEFYANPSDLEQVMAEALQYGEVSNRELQLRRPDGSIRWVLLSFRLHEGCPHFVMQDISDRKQREQSLRLIMEGTARKTGDEFFQSCVRYLAQVLQVRYAFITECIDETRTKARTLVVWKGDAIGENFEYSLQGTPCEYALTGKICYYPENIQTLFPDDPDLVTVGAESYLGVPLTDSSGNVLGILAVMDIKPMEKDPGREPILRIFAARAGAELERKRAEEALQRRAQVESLLSSISRQFIDQDVDTAINFTLQAIAQLIGVERSCIYEYSDDQTEFSLIHQWRATGVEPLPSLASGGTTTTFPWFNKQMFSGQVIRISSLAELPPEGELERELFTIQSTQSLVAVPTLHSGKVVGFLGVDVVRFSKTWSQEDINLLKLVGELIAIGRARHKAEEALKVAKEAAVREAARSVEANRAKSTFLANMSHELRTPLNAILGFAQLMERDAALNTHQRESLGIINRSGEHLLNLINDVLEMSKIESGRIVLNPTPFNLHLLLQTLQEMFQMRTEAKQLSLYFEIAPDLPQYVVTDEGKLSQVLINLLGNAVKFTQVGGVTLRVSVFNDQKQQKTDNELLKILFEVQDTGKGIALEEMDNLFQPFVQTTSGILTKEGTGLGLTISRQFIQLMGGDIRVTSNVDRGSTFSFEVPVTLAEPLAESQHFTKGRVLKLAPDQPVYRVLIVDDREENRELIWQLLQTVGFETRTAINGQEAIQEWQQWHPHLIWMDMRMPVMDGYEATRRIRAQEDGSRTTIIALTASAFEEQQASVLAAGCDDFVRKPFREPVIFEKIAEHLGVHYLYEEKQESLQASHFTLHASDLTVMPAEWIAQLNQAALAVDADQILQLIEQIPETNRPMADQLADLVRHFCFDEILALTEENCDI